MRVFVFAPFSLSESGLAAADKCQPAGNASAASICNADELRAFLGALGKLKFHRQLDSKSGCTLGLLVLVFFYGFSLIIFNYSKRYLFN